MDNGHCPQLLGLGGFKEVQIEKAQRIASDCLVQPGCLHSFQNPFQHLPASYYKKILITPQCRLSCRLFPVLPAPLTRLMEELLDGPSGPCDPCGLSRWQWTVRGLRDRSNWKWLEWLDLSLDLLMLVMLVMLVVLVVLVMPVVGVIVDDHLHFDFLQDGPDGNQQPV